jgi:NAD(P)-dependent dehydrogenase (short-subunit alcohol dehydrogenase family)
MVDAAHGYGIGLRPKATRDKKAYTMTQNPVSLSSLAHGYRALVIGATGAIGSAFVQHLRADPRCREVIGVSRNSPVSWDLRDQASIDTLALSLEPAFHLVIDATGALTLPQTSPEKRLQDLNAQALMAAMQVNAIGPVLLLKALQPLLARAERVIYAKLSARVGSIGDNRKGGWYGYRAAKAALNQLFQTAAIEMARSRSLSVVGLLQPGTVRSALSAPFVAAENATPAEEASAALLRVLDQLPASGNAHFVDATGTPVPW